MTRRPIRLRIFLPLALLATLVAAVGVSFVHQWATHQRDVREAAADALLLMADQLARSASHDLQTDPERVSAEVALAATEARSREVAVLDAQGLVRAHANRFQEGLPADRVLQSFDAARLDQALQTRLPVLWQSGDRHATIALSFSQIDGAAPGGQLRNLERSVVWVAFDLSHELSTARQDAMQELLPVLVAALLVCAALATFLLRQVTGPLTVLGDASQELAASGQLQRPVPEVGPMEVRNLARRFNEMARHIQQARQAIETAQARTVALVDTAMDAIVIVDSRQHIVMANRAASVLFRVEESVMLGQRIDTLLPELPPLNAPAVVQARRRDGDTFPAEVSMSHSLVGGEAFHTIILRDVTERRRAEEAIRTLNASLEATVEARTGELRATARALEAERAQLSRLNAEISLILDTATVGILLVKDRRVVRCNRMLETLFGYAPGEAVGRPTREWFDDEASYEALGRQLYDDVQAGRVHLREHEMVRRGGERFWARISARRFDYGEPGTTLAILEDITGEHEAAAALQAAKAQAESANEAKSRFLANMSHEIRTPMNAIIGMTHLALRTELSDAQRDYLHKIQMSSQHLLGLINDILDFSKVEAGKLTLEHIDFQLLPVVDNVFTLIGARAAEKGLELVLDMAPDVPNFLVGDPLRLGQVLINLGSNAVKFTERGQVVVRVRRQPEDTSRVTLQFEAQDTGIGLTPEQLAQLFQSFQQGDTSTSRIHGGTGLGLAICRRLVHLMDGDIGVHSQPGQGSTFWFTARFDAGEVPAQSVLSRGDPAGLAGRRALVVDDNAAARQVMQALLDNLGVHSEAAADGDEAVAAVRAAHDDGRPFDIVLMDWTMPRLNGIDAGRAIHALGLPSPPRLMLVTGRGRDEVLREALSAGFSTVMVKPVNASIVLDNLLLSLTPQVAPSPAADTPAPAHAPPASGRVLVVEDNGINQQIAREMLQDLGLAVEVAGNGQEALLRLEQSPPFDLVLMDMHMPVMDGLKATAALRRDPRWAALPVVAMTANVMPEDRARCREAGMTDFLAKPVDPGALLAVVRRCLPGVNPGPGPSHGPVPVANDPRLAPLQGIHGLDLRNGLRRCGHKADLYLELLRRFVDHQADTLLELAQLSASLRGGAGLTLDIEPLRLQVHSLKGVAGNLGATVLHSRCAALERRLRADPLSAGEAVGAVESTTRALGDALRAALGMHPMPAPRQPGSAESGEPLDLGELAGLLRGGDPDAIAWVERHAAMLQRQLGPDAQALLARVRQYEFDEALKRLAPHLSPEPT